MEIIFGKRRSDFAECQTVHRGVGHKQKGSILGIMVIYYSVIRSFLHEL